jgi:hypothetical protein
MEIFIDDHTGNVIVFTETKYLTVTAAELQEMVQSRGMERK